METLAMVIFIAIIAFNIVGIVWLGIELEHFILVPLAYIIGLIIISSINKNACLVVACIVAAITLIPVMVKIVKIIINIIKTIIDIREEINQNLIQDRLLKAIKLNDKETVKILIAKNAHVNGLYGGIDEFPLQIAIENCDEEMISLLIEEGADVNYYKNGKPLVTAVKNGDKRIVSLLIEKGAKVNLGYDGKLPLDCAESEELITLLKNHGAITQNEMEKEKDKFVYAVNDNDVAYVKSALEKYKQLADAKDENGLTVLLIASLQGYKEIVELLISHGVDVNMQCETVQNENALICASYKGHKDIVELLLANGATINARKSDGMDALMWASSRGYKDVAELLIDKGADVNSKDYEGFSPLMLAAQEGHIHLVEFLINKGAKVNVENYDGGTAIKLAYKGKHFDIVELLERNGARH